MTANAFITCRVTSETKARLRALANREGTNESAIMKRLLHDALRTLRPCKDSSPVRHSRVERRERVYARIGSEDRRLLKQRASARGLTSGMYVALLVRAHLQGRAPLPKAEYLALRESVLELRAIGRNLNQIARALNRGAYAETPGRAEFDAIMKVIEELRNHFRDLINANEVSWKNDGPTRH